MAVPAAESTATAEIVSGIASVASGLCPGAAICAGYTGQGPTSLASVLASVLRSRDEQEPGPDAEEGMASRYAAVVVPLALGPDPARDAYIADIVAQAGPAVILTPYLSPHPVLGGALHDRLAEHGLVRPRRISGLSLVTLSVGVVVAAPGGEESRQTAEAASIMLAARLGMPVAPACLGNQASIDSAVATLRQSGASELAIAPYMIGPEANPQELAAVAAATGARCGPLIGAHPALGQLATMRYGAALLEPSQATQHGPAQTAPGSPVRSDLLDRVRSGLVARDVPTDQPATRPTGELPTRSPGGLPTRHPGGLPTRDTGAQASLPDQDVQMGGGLHDGHHLVERVEVAEEPFPPRPPQRPRGFVGGAGAGPDHRGARVQPPAVMGD